MVTGKICVRVETKINWFAYYAVLPINIVRCALNIGVWLPRCAIKSTMISGDVTGQ